MSSMDFKILAVRVLDDGEAHKVDASPVYQCKVLSYHNQLTYTFDDRSGSWLTSKHDDKGFYKEPMPSLAWAMQEAVAQAIRAGTLGQGFDDVPEVSPFKDPEPAPADNPFLALVAKPEVDNPFLAMET